MFERIIVGVDEHGGGEGATALARKLLARAASSPWRKSSRTMATDTAARARLTRLLGGSAQRSCSRRFGRTLASMRT